MHTRNPLHALFAACVTALLGCTATTGTTSSEPTMEPEPQASTAPASTGAEAEAAPKPDPWAQMDDAKLRTYVRSEAQKRLAEVQPDFKVDQMDAYVAEPEKAPALAGRAVERLMELAMVELAEGKLDRAAGIVRLVRSRAKNRNSAFAGSTLLTTVAMKKAGDDGEAQKKAIAAVFRELPRARFGSSTVVFQVFQAEEQLTAQVAETKSQMLSLETASAVVFFGQILPEVVKNRDTFLKAIGTVKAEHDKKRPPRDYRFATVDLKPARDAKEVVVAVWDVGTNPKLFEKQLFVSPSEETNGKDDDGNGLVDDVSGVVSDLDAPNTALLYEPKPEVLEKYAGFLQGIMDLRAGMASSEAAKQVLELMRSATDPEKLVALEKNLNDIGEWAHGTHVAGIMLAGVPQAKVAIFRSAWAGEARTYFHRGPTDEELAAERANVGAIAKFINQHDIKVVNASLGFGEDYLEAQLRYETDKYKSENEIKARAKAIHKHRTETWNKTFKACPNTLFVVAAGNSNRDVVEYGDIPAASQHDNLITVGAVDQWGNWATFTNSNPDRVKIFDHGVAVKSLIPSGETVPLSGTSMASPNVANLATKLYAVHPGLTPAEAIGIIVETGDPIAEPFNGRIANEKKAIKAARKAARNAAREAKTAKKAG